MEEDTIENPVPKIHRLEKEVVNRIAAGEVVQRPENAVKELLENSLDAGSDAVTITCKDGGLKFLLIKDNGHGIRKEDMAIVCERFTTSKLKKFEDLREIATFGFRGEALASISHIAHISITSMTADAPCAYKASYRDGKMLTDEPSPTAGVKGTSIQIEDLFYNVPSRLKVLQKPQEEYVRIINMVTKYALHNHKVSFTLLRKGEVAADVRTNKTDSQIDTIKLLYGQEIAKECVALEKSIPLASAQASQATNHNEQDQRCLVKGFITKPNYAAKKGTFILFINQRLVECKPLKTVIDKLYSEYLSKISKGFIYLALDLPPQIVDVNVHPTKSEVRFLHQDFIIDQIKELLFDKLRENNAERTFLTQTLLISAEEKKVRVGTEGDRSAKTISPTLKVRTDSKEQTLNAFYTQANSLSQNQTSPDQKKSTPNDFFIYGPKKIPAESIQIGENEEEEEPPRPKKKQKSSDGNAKAISNKDESSDHDGMVFEEEEEDGIHEHHHHHKVGHEGHHHPPGEEGGMDAMDVDESNPNSTSSAAILRTPVSSSRKQRKKPLLTSVEQLLEKVTADSHSHLHRIFHEHTFVGCVDHFRILLQHATDLYICNLADLSAPAVYQEVLAQFGEFDAIILDPTPSLIDLLELGIQVEEKKNGNDAVSKPRSSYEGLLKTVLSQREMLSDYFRIEIDSDGNLKSLPQIIADLPPNFLLLPSFVYALVFTVNWNAEMPCLEGIAIELSKLFALPKVAPKQITQVNPKWNAEFVMEHSLLPAMKRSFQPPVAFATNGSVVRIASLDKLYKVFERC